MLSKTRNLWRGPAGMRQVLMLSIPLVISVSAASLQMFIDRIFLTWYDPQAMAGSLQAGITVFAIIWLFQGVVSYVNTFVAQYLGANHPERVGPIIWQGFYLSVISSVIMAAIAFTAPAIFRYMGHPHEVYQAEVIYFKVLAWGASTFFFAAVLSGFFTGKSDMKTVMWVNLIATIANIVLDWILIFGKMGFPRLGVAGAAIATIVATAISVLLFASLYLTHGYRLKYKTLSGFRFDPKLTKRLIRFGFPNGLHMLLDIGAIAFFSMIIGRIDDIALAATSIAWGINALAFMPAIGIGNAVTVVVGNMLGRNDPQLAARATWSGFIISTAYMVAIAAGYVFFPEFFVFPFKSGANVENFPAIEHLTINLLYFVAFYSLFDSANVIFASALKGAGDTRFVMIITVVLSWSIMVVPSWIAVRLGMGIYIVWAFGTAYFCVLAFAFLLRFLGGKWKQMRVIETIPPIFAPNTPKIPSIEIETI